MYITDHIGYLTDSIEQTSKVFETLGYYSGDIVNDDTQRTRICFLSNERDVLIELVEPYEDNRTMCKLLSKRGVSPYHICYQVDDIDAAYRSLIADDWIALFRPVKAPAMEGRKICYFFKRELGFIELVEKAK